MNVPFLYKVVVGLLLLITLTGCGGGGGSSLKASDSVWISDLITGLPTQAIPSVLQSTVPIADNVIPITVGFTNKLLVSLTVCASGSNACQVVDKIMVDTGSVGLRIHASVLSSLQGQLSPLQQSGQVISQCATFGNFYTWGSFRTADVTFGARKANALPFQLYDDPTLPDASATGCGAQIGGLLNALPTAVQFNGILGIRGARLDHSGSYLTCQAGGNSCTATVLSDSQLLPNPVISLPLDNNGYQIVMPNIPDGGALQVSGALVLGLNTQANNSLAQTVSSASQLLTLDSQQRFSLYVEGVSYGALMDSGTSVNTLPIVNAPTCGTSAPLGYCPSSTVMQIIKLAAVSKPGLVFDSNLLIDNWLTLLATNFPAMSNIASKTPSTIKTAGTQAILGAPFFYGRRIGFSIDGQPVWLNNTSIGNNFIAFD